MAGFPNTHLDLLGNEKKAFAYLATLRKDGTPQVTPVWFNTEGEFILVNTAIGRIKDKNMRARSHVTLCIVDPANPYRYLQIHGKVVDFTQDQADEHIDALTMKYRGIPKYPSRQPGEKRIIYKILPLKFDAHG
jgi:PPOX class probable F420-dependent enzyme